MGFWEQKTLSEMTDAEWESLCDGCGLCCLHKLEDVETPKSNLRASNVVISVQVANVRVYDERVDIVDDCLNVRDLDPEHYRWLPESCAYRRLEEGRPLPKWHPLIAGDDRAMEEGGHAVGDWAISDHLVTADVDFIVRIKASES